ncbi:hypothetical protein Kpol_1005p10 [Vanderwaltozyma polyspora DSM 70294]|uniref:BSD domain-containing protein n=1 Tax=Vanderwaltozyma polyspora (strain ATCC 22028 / DSM 70294 / BCRC 21397 / CBS 2163 / NBRC 10782 / NRRL Y-8283 / UCD 57-17) TaxID=436907 RepID=A7TS36_VANPO|nr:uncharacterized protein Kpol_1005p10 [Vanderwaltozyma polyspora DSM 70294]EDO14922.1 hypothetical protein Kpol_1005p10 [Vanderwaltozyma polyspora DSM 70294]
MSHSGAAIFKKVSGIITINEDTSPAELTWRSTSGDNTHLVVLDTIDKLQATPSTSEKLMLRLISKVDETKKIKDNDGNEVTPKPITHTFSFNNRTVMDNIKITLQNIITRYKDAEIYEEKTRKEAEAGTPVSASATPSAPLINTTKLDDSLSREKLLSNFKLQQSLLKENKNLMRTFQETVIHSGLPPDEFWSTRVSLLRAFALSTSQKVGPYNVLSTIKPVASSDNKVHVNISRDKILNIFQNYPIVKKAYTDNVPKNFKEPEFWARFFSSKLFRKLRGERIMHNDRGDVIIDRYLTLDQEYDRQDDVSLMHDVRKIIDIEGNAQDDPELLGNRPNFTMQAGRDVNGNSDGTVDILRGMNRLSEKMMRSLENEYSRSNLSNKDMDDGERSNLQISDLHATFTEDYATIHLKNEPAQDSNPNTAKNTQIKVEITEVKDDIDKVLNKVIGKIDLTNVKASLEAATKINQEINTAVRINAKQAKHNNIDTMLGAFIGNGLNDSEAKAEIPIELLDSCRLLHSTCCEFLKHFYIHFQSGEPKQASTVKKLCSNLKDCDFKINELLDDVHKGDGESVAAYCKAYLSPTLASIALAIKKYDDIAVKIKQATPPN